MKIANIFGRNALLFSEHNEEADITLYIQNHEKEANAFEDLYVATNELEESIKLNPPRDSFDEVPRHGMYDGTMGTASAIAKHETLCADAIIQKTNFLFDKKSIFLAGDIAAINDAMTDYMHRWWDKGITPHKALTYFTTHTSEDFEEAKKAAQNNIDKYLKLSRLYIEYDSCRNLGHNPYAQELNEFISSNSVSTEVNDHVTALTHYQKAIMRLRTYEYMGFIKQLDDLSQKTNTVLGDSFEKRAQLLDPRLPVKKAQFDFDKRVFGLTALEAGYQVTRAHPSDTELVRIVLQQRNFPWYINTEGLVIASNRRAKLFNSISDLTVAMCKAGFLRGEAPNEPKSIHWEIIPETEEEFKRELKKYG
ncbi:hypothetical protein BAAM0499_07855 [Bifidobacterium animalis subsp. animalis MCC 0499]|nr:hypothetical protein BAAM0499_07855 [Bifidobacterium animalis subsp. animalis MCC 0499]